jgi:hypothetical protein
MNTIVNHKSKDIFQVSGAENRQAGWQDATPQKRRDSKCDCLGSCPGQAIAARRAAPERRSKQTWPVTPNSTASKRRFSRSSAEAKDATLKAVFLFLRDGCASFPAATRPASDLLLLRILWHKPFQRAIQSLPDPNNRCEKHVQFSRFNSLMALARRSRRMLSPSCFSHGERVFDFDTHNLSEISSLTDTAFAP